MEKVNMKSMDIVKTNVDKIGALFPNCITEAKNDKGEVEKAVDFDKLRQELSRNLVEGKKERYEFSWPDKRQAIVTANAPISKTLRPLREKSVDFDTTQNVYIEGDNLDALKLLQETYLGKIKMIYIDPPYNTGNDFVYEDDFSADVDDYLQSTGDADELGNKYTTNKNSNGRFHTDWLNMIYPRLKIARELLSEDGVIFISIDDCEVSNLRKICDELFGESNFVSNLIWQKKFSRSNDATYFSTMHDHILCYCKSSILRDPNGWVIGLLPRKDEIPSGYDNPDNDSRGMWTSVILSAKSGSSSLLYEIVTPSGRSFYPPSGRYWSCNKETFEKWKADGRIWFGKDGNSSPRKKTFLSEVQAGLRPNSILFQDEAGNNQEAKQELKELFDGYGVFDGPKPVKLLRLLIKIANTKKNDIIMDFFSGSATTAQAIMETAKESNDSIKYILIQLAEDCPEESEALLHNYNTICDLGEERIRRAGKKIKEEAGLLGDNLDIGFRVFKIDDSNMKDVYYRPDEFEQDLLSSVEDNIKEDRTPEDLLFQVMIDDFGIPLSANIEKITVSGKTIFNVEKGHLVACFDAGVTDEVITAMAKLEPNYAVLRDSSYYSDSVAVNFEQIFKKFSPGTTTKIL